MKNMKRIMSTIVILAFVVIGLTSCKKYEEGGLIRKGDDKILNTWKLQSYHRNGTDETSLIYIQNYSEQYSDGGGFTRIYTDKDGDIDSESGTWTLKNDNKEVHTSGVSSINDFSNSNNSVSSSMFTILKLTDDEYWYYFENGGDKHEFHFTK